MIYGGLYEPSYVILSVGYPKPDSTGSMHFEHQVIARVRPAIDMIQIQILTVILHRHLTVKRPNEIRIDCSQSPSDRIWFILHVE